MGEDSLRQREDVNMADQVGGAWRGAAVGWLAGTDARGQCRRWAASKHLHRPSPVRPSAVLPRPSTCHSCQALAAFIVIQAALKRSAKLRRFSARCAWRGTGGTRAAAVRRASCWPAAVGWLLTGICKPARLPPPARPHPPAPPPCHPSARSEDLNARLPNYQVSMGFGLHVGEWRDRATCGHARTSSRGLGCGGRAAAGCMRDALPPTLSRTLSRPALALALPCP